MKYRTYVRTSACRVGAVRGFSTARSAIYILYRFRELLGRGFVPPPGKVPWQGLIERLLITIFCQFT